MTLNWSEQYKSGYKQGVVDGTRLLGLKEADRISGSNFPELATQNVLDDRRKELLTRKVTKRLYCQRHVLARLPPRGMYR